jgi:hypothetical protein
MKATDIIKKLKTDFWISTVSRHEFPFITKMKTPPLFKVYPEVTVRIETDEKTRFGKPKAQRRRFDAVALLKPHYKAYEDDLLTVGFEVKVAKSDLTGDLKFLDYLGFTDFFFFAVPSHLVGLAKKKAEISKHIGVIDAERGTIELMPERQQVSEGNMLKVCRQIVFSTLTA